MEEQTLCNRSGIHADKLQAGPGIQSGLLVELPCREFLRLTMIKVDDPPSIAPCRVCPALRNGPVRVSRSSLHPIVLRLGFWNEPCLQLCDDLRV